ncbi:unnamed protein product [Mytilus edulis]|uniref:Uncharacterized protein n=1 Tax=Mytilus edulis TaxID=6550 RepID=A0A8S3S460_MYTED|nr:unnamed protein product [Mytilus edulis]
MKQLYVLEEQETSKICQLLSSLEKKEKEIGEYQTSILNIKQHATDLQMFLSMKQIEQEAHSKHTFMQSLVESGRQPTLSYTINTSIQNIISQIKSFGEVRIESKSFDMVLIKKKSKQAQLIVPAVQPRSIEDIFSNSGLKDFEVKMPCKVFYIAYISQDNALAVTSGNSEMCIIIVDIEKKQIKKTILLDSNSYGIALKDNQLIYSGHDKGIRMINLYDESIRDIVRNKMPMNCYTATFRNNIYHTNYITGKHCYML